MGCIKLTKQEDAWKQWATHEIQRLHEMVSSLNANAAEDRYLISTADLAVPRIMRGSSRMGTL